MWLAETRTKKPALNVQWQCKLIAYMRVASCDAIFLRKYFSSAVLQQRSSFLGVGKREYEKRNPVEQRKKALTLLRIYERIFKRLWAKVNAF